MFLFHTCIPKNTEFRLLDQSKVLPKSQKCLNRKVLRLSYRHRWFQVAQVGREGSVKALSPSSPWFIKCVLVIYQITFALCYTCLLLYCSQKVIWYTTNPDQRVLSYDYFKLPFITFTFQFWY